MQKRLSYEPYQLIFEDDFHGPELDRSCWNVELHEPGWVNEEWQEYIDSPDTVCVRDGNLMIRPVKTVLPDGTIHYTSGRISTQNKHDFTYGLFEARLKVPKGKGFLPAFWLMTTDEEQYGRWPVCGETKQKPITAHCIMAFRMNRTREPLHCVRVTSQRNTTALRSNGSQDASAGTWTACYSMKRSTGFPHLRKAPRHIQPHSTMICISS